jgi:phosphatidate cytidylyltransferase
MLKTRLVTALVLALPTIGLIWWAPSWLFAGLVLLVMFLAAREWARLIVPASPARQRLSVLGVIAGLLGIGWVIPDPVATLQGTLPQNPGLVVLLVVTVLWWVLVLFLLATYRPGWGERRLGRWWRWLSAPLTLIPAGATLFWLQAYSPVLLLYVIVLVAATDSGAFFAGRRFGRHALAPEISPGKTREGLWGGLLAAFAVALVAAWGLDLPAGEALAFVLLGVVVSLVSTVGDLQESILKREAGVKDSGCLLPGHGGVLDRIDSLTAAVPLFFAGWWWLSLPWPGGIP